MVDWGTVATGDDFAAFISASRFNLAMAKAEILGSAFGAEGFGALVMVGGAAFTTGTLMAVGGGTSLG